jgi:hypothetical protein
LLDENLPQKLVPALRAEGHEVESVHTLRMQGLENGKLYAFALDRFDLFFTRDYGFANNLKQSPTSARLKLLRVVLPQKPQDIFVADFVTAFLQTDFAFYQHCDDWPQPSRSPSAHA